MKPAVRHTTLKANGLEFACDVSGDSEDVALLLHGFPESRFSWRFQLPFLAAQGWRAVAPDLRGYGQSSRPEGKAAYHIDHLIDDVVGMFEVLKPRRKLLVAHDWGAVIAWVVAMRRAVDLDGLIIMNVPHPTVFGELIKHYRPQQLKSWYVAFFQIPWLPEFLLRQSRAQGIANAFLNMAVDKGAFPPHVLEEYRRNALIPGALTAMINYYRANLGILDETSAPIDVPTLMLWGEEDTALDVKLTEGYGPHVKDFTLVRFPNVSHWVQQEAPVPVNSAMLEWLRTKGLALGPAPHS
ncbi:alpha/beta fold hydrolase [Sandarakinorhabdus rubra]|uniref:alpha/beta fold hydrolase n=1 Tax=Sandarakinorhabdus rubra TaxID=2672568 RepID=UPI0013DB07FA|nr:alpha/beta hydrolase [Sandarakinorhabdus rubra]